MMSITQAAFIVILLTIRYASTVYCQDTVVLSIVMGAYEVPLELPRGVFIFSSQIPHDSSRLALDMERKLIVIQRFSFDVRNLVYIPGDENRFNGEYQAIVFKKPNSRELYFSVDTNKNQDFLDDEVVMIQARKPFYYELPFLLSESDSTFLSVPFQLEYTMAGNLSAISLLKYHVAHETEDTTFSAELNLGVYYPNFSFLALHENADDSMPQNFVLGEPFFFVDAYWVLTDLDVVNNTISLIKLNENTRPRGYKQGYFVNLDFLFDFHDMPSAVINQSDSSLFLLYFWGKWCQPCLNEMPSTNKLGMIAQANKNLTMYGVALLGKNEQPSDISKFVQEKEMVFPNFIESFDDPLNSIRNQLNIQAFPTYILLDSEGQILFRGGNINGLKPYISDFTGL